MAMTSWPRVNEDTTDTQYAELFNSIIGSGVRDTDSLVVSADSSGLNVKVAAGFAVVAGNAFLSSDVETLTIAPNTGTTTRTDSIILRRSFSAAAGKTVSLLVKQGSTSYASDIRSTFEVPLATVTVTQNAATITSANVTDRRRYLATNVGIWETAQRPTHRKGILGYNTSSNAWEQSTGSAWVPLYTWETIPNKPNAIPVNQGGTGATTAASARSNLGAAAADHSHTWAQVTGKPSTFPPSTHGHSLTDSNITGTLPVSQGGTGATSAASARSNLGAAASSHSHAWSDITGRPSTFPPSTHGHSLTDSNITGTLPVSQGGTGATSAAAARSNIDAAASSHSHSWGQITGKPSTFAPSSHNHSASNITSGTLPVSRGGTGASTASDALEALGIYVQSSAPAHSNGRVWIKR